MPETDTTQGASGEPNGQQPDSTGQPATGEPVGPGDGQQTLGEGGKKALDEERKARKAAEKELGELKTRLQAIEDKDKSELERAQSRLQELEQQYGEEKAQRLRLSVASEHSIPADYVDLLTATDEESLTAQAKRVAELVKANQAPEYARNPGQGAGSGEPAKPTVSSGRELYKARHIKP